MAVPRGSSTGRVIRGTRVGAGPRAGKPETSRRRATEVAADPQRPRAVVDYTLARRAVLHQVSVLDQLDANRDHYEAGVYLRRAARYHGVATDTPCPVCRKADLTAVSYAFADSLDEGSGSARGPAELKELAGLHRQLRVFVVDVCTACGWNHPQVAYTIGTEAD